MSLRKCSKVHSLALQSLSCEANLAIGHNPRIALELFDRLGLYSTIFTDPTTPNTPEPSTNRWRRAYDCLEIMRANNSPGSIYNLLVCSADAVDLSWLLVALVPWAEVTILRPSRSGGKAPLPFATLVAREGIKASNRVCDMVTGAFRHVEEITNFKQAVIAQEKWTLEPDKLGMAIRRWDAGGRHWKLQVLLAILVDVMRSDKSAGEYRIVRLFQTRGTNTPYHRIRSCLVWLAAVLGSFAGDRLNECSIAQTSHRWNTASKGLRPKAWEMDGGSIRCVYGMAISPP